MTDDFAVDGIQGAYVPCEEQAAELVVEEEGAISGLASGYVAKDESAAALPATERAAIVGSGVGYVPGPCVEECLPAGNAQGVNRAYKRYTPATSVILNGLDQTQFPPRPPTIDAIASVQGAGGLAADGRGRELTTQYTVPSGLAGLRLTIAIKLGAGQTTGNAMHPRCYSDMPFSWELRRAGWGASFTQTYDDFQLDTVGSLLTAGAWTPPVTICNPVPPFADRPLTFLLTTYTDDFLKDANGKIQLQLRVVDLDAAAAYEYNNTGYGSSFWSPADEAGWDRFLYSHSVVFAQITACALE